MAEQLTLDPLVPHGRVKFTLAEVARILGHEGKPLSIRAVREALDSGQLGGYRLALSAKPGEEQRIKQEFVTADDLNLYLARQRTLDREECLSRLLRLIDSQPAAQLDLILRHATAARARAPKR